MQWSTDQGGSASFGDRTITLHSAPELTQQGGLVVKAAPSGPSESTTATGWVDVPEMAGSLATAANADLEVTFSAEAFTSGARMFVRALVDGQPADPSDVVFARGDFSGSRSFTFTRRDLSAGAHTVVMQWSTDQGGSASFGDRTITLHSAPELTQQGGLVVKAAPSGPSESTTATGWVDVPEMAGSLATAANADLEVTFSAEAFTSGARMFVRALVDGQPADPSDVVFARGDFSGSRSFTFTRRDLSAGAHTVVMQWSTDQGGSASFGDRTITVNHWLGQVPDINQPFDGLKPTTGTRQVLTILWDPHRVDHPRPSRQAVEDLLFGDGPSVRNYFNEVSGGRFSIANAGILGWYDAAKDAEHYWNHPTTTCSDGFLHGHVEKWAEAIRRASLDVNMAAFDTDHDGTLGPEDLTLLIVIPQNDPFGTQRGVVGQEHPSVLPLVVDGVRVDTMVEAYIGSPPSMGLVAHELSHIMLNTGDMYFTFFQPYAAGPYSIMDQSPHQPPHLDPFHKLRLGWLAPVVVSSTGWYALRDVETHGEVHILYSPLRGDSEYFIVENRWRGGSLDSHIPHSGLAVWHIIEDASVYDNLPTPPGVDAQNWNDPKWKGWGRRAIRMIRPIYGPPINWHLWDGTNPATGYDLQSADADPNHVTLRWVDGTASGFAIRGIPPPSPTMNVHITVPQ